MSIISLLPELWLLGVVCALFVAALSDRKQSVMNWLPLAAGLGVLAALASLGARGEFLYATYKLDALSQFFKLVIAFGFAVVAGIASGNKDGKDLTPDYFMLLGLSEIGRAHV